MGAPKNHKVRFAALWISLALSVSMLITGNVFIENIDVGITVSRLLVPLLRLMFFIIAGLTVGQMIEAMGWTAKLGGLGAPLFRFARLGTRCSSAFSTAFISGTAANAMLFQFWQDGKINRTQMIMTHLANQLPAFFLHLPTTMFIVLPLTGMAGGFYFLLTFIAAVFRLMTVLMLGHWRPAAVFDMNDDCQNICGPEKKKTAAWQTIRKKLPRRFVSVATYVVPIYIAVFLLNNVGVFEWTRHWLTRWVAVRFVPMEALSLVVLSFAAEFTSGFAAAGALLHEGVVTTKQAVLALLIGNVVAFPIRALRHQLPRLMGIFAPKLGLQLIILGQGFRIMSLVLVGMIYYMFF